MQCASLSEGKYGWRADILKAAIGHSVSGMLSPVFCERDRGCMTHDNHAARDQLRPKKAPAQAKETVARITQGIKGELRERAGSLQLDASPRWQRGA